MRTVDLGPAGPGQQEASGLTRWNPIGRFRRWCGVHVDCVSTIVVAVAGIAGFLDFGYTGAWHENPGDSPLRGPVLVAIAVVAGLLVVWAAGAQRSWRWRAGWFLMITVAAFGAWLPTLVIVFGVLIGGDAAGLW